MRPHGKAFATEREERPISRLQHLGEPNRYAHRCSGATVRDSHEGPLKNRGGSYLKPAKKHKTQTHPEPTQNIRAQHSPHRDGPRGPPERPNKAPPRARSASLEGSHSLERAPPLSRVHAILERAPPRSRVPASLERAPPPSRLPHKRACSRTRVRAFNALTQQSRAITRLGITSQRCSANFLGGAHPHHYGGLCDEAGVSSVTLCRPL
jgi:hypothetical protein